MDDLLFSLFRLLDDWSPFFRPEPEGVPQRFDSDDKRAAVELRTRQDLPEEFMQSYVLSQAVAAKR
jgi:hypothetical protein